MSTLRFASLGSLLSLGLALFATPSCVAERAAPATAPSAPATATAASGTTAPPTAKYGEVPGESLVPDGGIKAFKVNGKAERVQLSYVKVEGQPFAEALRAEIKTPSANNWDVQVQTSVPKAVNAGDVMLATFYFRTEWTPKESSKVRLSSGWSFGTRPKWRSTRRLKGKPVAGSSPVT